MIASKILELILHFVQQSLSIVHKAMKASIELLEATKKFQSIQKIYNFSLFSHTVD